jgi:cytochrome c oxidase subunit 3
MASASQNTAAVTDLPVPPNIAPERTLSAPQWGMVSFLLSEVAFFSTLIVAYISFMGRDTIGPTPREALELPFTIVTTILLLSSSLTIHLAEKALARQALGTFRLAWFLTIALGFGFLVGTGIEWHGLITRHSLTIGRNLFGTSYYTLVGFHALHVSGGVIALSIVLGMSLAGRITAVNEHGVQLVSWYWHFVDVVWIAVFILVYIVSR